MTIVKHKDISYKEYIRLLAEAGTKVSDIEKAELAGHLLRRDMEGSNDRVNIFNKIMGYDNLLIGDVIASCLIVELPESVEDLVKTIKFSVVEYYEKEMEWLIKEEEKLIEEERREARLNENPNDEYDPNDDI